MPAYGSQRSILAWCLLMQLCTMSSSLRSRRHAYLEVKKDNYSFDVFVQDFRKQYKQGTAEYQHRRASFDESMAQIHSINAQAGRSWSAGVHPFMDWTAEERQGLRGYQLSRKQSAAPLVAMQVSTTVYGEVGDSVVVATPAVRQQGVCGSCWAIAATEAVEALIVKHGGDAKPSVEALLECVENPQHCGGSGGCGGATPELAFDYMAENGVPTEENLAYKSGNAGNCPSNGSPYPADWSRVYINGFTSLPSNEAQPLMKALVEQGPVVISADSSGWTHYMSGIFDGCSKDAVIDHSILAKGYGASDDQKYWLLQNSWGQEWGEDGLLRLLRHDDEDGWCGTDSKPHMGGACDGQQEPFRVCGSCGLLFDSLIPYGARVDLPKNKAADAFQADASQADAQVSNEAVSDGFAVDNKTLAAVERMKHMVASTEKTTDPGEKAEDYYANFARSDPGAKAQQNAFLRSAIAQDSSSQVYPQPKLSSQHVDSQEDSDRDASDLAGGILNGDQDPKALDQDLKVMAGDA